MKLSIIIPVYNVEKYIERCLLSFYKIKTPSNEYEIIIIDDESLDSSIEKVKFHMNKFENIRIIHQKNKGLGGARNTGLKEAKGEYVFFCDSDDFIIPNSFDSFFNKIYTSKVEIGIGNFYNYFENEEYYPSSFSINVTEPMNLTGYECIKKYYRKYINTMVWRSIYKREYLLKNNFFFNEEIYFEDVNWTPKVITNAERIKYFPILFYNYVQRKGSIINSSFSKKKFEDRLFVNKDLLIYSKKCPKPVQKELGYLAIIGTFLAIGKWQYINIDKQQLNKIKSVITLPCSHYFVIKILIIFYLLIPQLSNYIFSKHYGK